MRVSKPNSSTFAATNRISDQIEPNQERHDALMALPIPTASELRSYQNRFPEFFCSDDLSSYRVEVVRK